MRERRAEGEAWHHKGASAGPHGWEASRGRVASIGRGCEAWRRRWERCAGIRQEKLADPQLIDLVHRVPPAECAGPSSGATTRRRAKAFAVWLLTAHVSSVLGSAELM